MTKSILFSITELSVGQYWYWTVRGYPIHRQVLITTWFVLTIIRTISLTANQNLEIIPNDKQNFTEYITEFIRDIAKTQIGESEYLTWVPFLGTIFLFIFVSQTNGSSLKH